MFGTGSFLTIWNVVDKGKYYEVELSSNKKNKQTGEYECDFSSKFIRFVGRAYQLRPMPNQKIKITNCGVTNCYMQDGKRVYSKNPTYLVFDYELQDGAVSTPTTPYNPYSATNTTPFEPLDLAEEGSLPF